MIEFQIMQQSHFSLLLAQEHYKSIPFMSVWINHVEEDEKDFKSGTWQNDLLSYLIINLSHFYLSLGYLILSFAHYDVKIDRANQHTSLRESSF